MTHKEVQNIARSTMNYIHSIIKVGMSLSELRSIAENKMFELGATSFWYWGIGAFIFSGADTTISVSGKEYLTEQRKIEKNDIITVDLSPQWKDIWGDYARTIIIEDGKVVEHANKVKNKEWQEGLITEDKLHNHLLNFVNTQTNFEQLYFYMNEQICSYGYKNLDFLGNLGHSIVKRKEDRIYIEKGNATKISDVSYFTFEPHIAKSCFGFKKENIYYFKGGRLEEL